MRGESLLYDLTNGLFELHPIFYASDTYRATWCIHLSAPPPSSLLSPWLTPWSSLPSRDLSLVLLLSLQHSKAWLFHGFTRAPFLHFFFTPVHITTNYVPEQPSLLAGLLNGYNLALFTTRAARSPV